MNKIFKTIWNKSRQAYVAASEISQVQHGHGFGIATAGLVSLISFVLSAEAFALGPSFTTEPTVGHRRKDASVALTKDDGKVEAYLDFLRKDENTVWSGVWGFNPSTGHNPYFFSAAYGYSGANLTIGQFLLDRENARLYAVYSTDNRATGSGSISANSIILNAKDSFLIPTQAYSTSGTIGTINIKNNLDLKIGTIVLVNGPAEGTGTLDVGNRLYVGPGALFKTLHLTDKNDELDANSDTVAAVHSGDQIGILRTKILDIQGRFNNSNEYTETGRSFTRTAYISDSMYLGASADDKVGQLSTGTQLLIGSGESKNNIAVGKNLVLRGSWIATDGGVRLQEGGTLIVSRNSSFPDTNNLIRNNGNPSGGGLTQTGGKMYIGLPENYSSILSSSIEGLTKGDVQFQVMGDVVLSGGSMEVNTVATDLVMFHRNISLSNNYELINNGKFRILGTLSLADQSQVKISQKDDSLTITTDLNLGGESKFVNNGIVSVRGQVDLSSSSSLTNNTNAVFAFNGGGNISTRTSIENKGYLQLNKGTFDVSGSLINEATGNIRVGNSESSDSTLNINSNFSSPGELDVFGKANFKGNTTTLSGDLAVFSGGSVVFTSSNSILNGKTNIYGQAQFNGRGATNLSGGTAIHNGGTVSISSSSFIAGAAVSVAKGGRLNLTYTNAEKFFTPGNYQAIPYDIVDGSRASMGKTNAAFAEWNESKLTSDSTLNNLRVSSGGEVQISDASSLNKRQVLELQKAWGQKSDLAEGSLDFTGSETDVNEIKDRLTVKVANAIGATTFLSHSLDGRDQQLSSTNTAISDVVSSPKAIIVGTGSSNLKSGFGFKSIEYTTGVTVNSGAELRLFGTRNNPNYYLIQNGENPSSVAVSGTLTLGLPYSFSDTAYGDAEDYGGRLSSLNLTGSLSVVKGTYRIDSLIGSGSVSTIGGSNSNLSIGESSGSTRISLTPTTTLELKTSETTGQTLGDIYSHSGTIKSLQGNYSAKTISSPTSQTNVTLEVGSANTSSSLASGNIALIGTATVFGNSTLKLGSGSEKNTITNVNLKPNSTLEINKRTEVGTLSASNATFVQTADEIIASHGWFQNSRINLRGGRLLSSNIRNSSGTVTNDLGSNTYVVEGSSTSFTSQGTNPHPPFASGWDSKYTLLDAERVTSSSDITLKQGGILKAKLLSLSGTTSKIHMNGGLLSTTMDQFFSSLGYRPVIQLNETSVENVKYGIADVGNIKNEIASGVDGNSGWLVFNDELVLKEAAIAATNRLHTSPSKLTSGVGIEFSGEIEGEFTVDDANQFQNDSRYNHAVVFSETSLYNKTNVSGSTNKKVILTGSKGSASGTNYITANTGFGFSNVFNATNVEVAGGKRFVLTGTEMVSGDLGHIHQDRDSSFFSSNAALLPNGNGSGTLRASGSGSVFSLGSQYALTPRKGWADKFETTSQGKLEVRNGEFALWTISNNGSTDIFADAYLHSRGISGVGSWKNDGTLYLEDNATPVTGQNTFTIAGRFVNNGVLDGSDAAKNGVTVASGATLTNESSGRAEFEKLAVNGTAVNKGNEIGASLKIGNTGQAANNNDSRWGAIEIASGGSYTNTGGLNENVPGTLNIAAGGSMSNTAGAEANFSVTNVSSGTSGAKPEILNEGVLKTGVTTTAGKIENRADMDANSLSVQNHGLITNKDSLSVEGKTIVATGGEIVNENGGDSELKELTVSGSVNNAGSMAATALTANNSQALIKNTGNLAIETALVQSGTLNNSGTSEVTGSTISVGSSGNIINSGELKAANAGSMAVASGGVVSNTGEITAEKAALTLAGTINNNDGNFRTLSMELNAGTMSNTGSRAVVETGDINANTGSKITNSSGASISGQAFTAVGGVFENKDNSTAVLQSANLTNSAQLNNLGTARIEIAGSVDAANSSITNVGHWKSEAIHLTQNAVLINKDSAEAKMDFGEFTSDSGTSVILQKGQIYANRTGIDGTLQVNAGSRLTIGAREDGAISDLASAFGEHAAVTNSGTIDLQGDLTNRGVINSEHGTINIASDKEFINEGASIRVENLTGTEAIYTHNNGVLTVTGGWLNSSTVNLNSGIIDTRGVVPSGSSIPGLGNNTYNVATPNGGIAPSGQTGSYNHFEAGDWKNGKTVLIATSLDSSSGAIVNVNSGGVFSVENLNLEGATNPALILNGGAVETTLDQIFVGEGEKAAVGIGQKDPSTPNGLIGGYGDLREGIREGVRVDDQKSWFVFTDDNLMATDASSAIAVLSENNMTSQVGFTGIISGQFNVSDANRFQESVLEDGKTPRDHDVVFYSTVLANQTDEQPTQNSVLIISNSDAQEVNDGKNYLRVSNIGFGFQGVSEAENLEISAGKKFVLVGSSHAGFSHNKGDLTDEQVFDVGHKLLTTSSNGGSIAVKGNSELYFGTEFLDGLTSGWVQKSDIEEGSSLTVRKGDFASWNLVNNGRVTITEGALLHNRKMLSSGAILNQGTLYLEKDPNDPSSGQFALTDASILNEGVLDAAEGQTEITLKGASSLTAEEGTTSSFSTLTVNEDAKVEIKGEGTGETLNVSGNGSYKIGSTSENTWDNISVSGGSLVNEGVLNPVVEGEEPSQPGNLTVSGGQFVNDGKADFNHLQTIASEGAAAPAVMNKSGKELSASMLDLGSDFLNEGNLTAETAQLSGNAVLDNQNILSSGTVTLNGSSTLQNKDGSLIHTGRITFGENSSLMNNEGARAQINTLTANDSSVLTNEGLLETTEVALGGTSNVTNAGTLLIKSEESEDPEATVKEARLTLSENAVLNNKSEITNEGKTEISGGVLNNSGSLLLQDVQVNGGTLNNLQGSSEGGTAPGSISGTSLTVENGSVNLQEGTSNEWRTVQINGGSVVNDAGRGENSGAWHVSEEFTVTDGTITNHGKITGGSDLTLSGGTLTNTGSMGMGEVVVNNGATLINDAHSELTGTKITVDDGAKYINDDTAVAHWTEANFTGDGAFKTETDSIFNFDKTAVLDGTGKAENAGDIIQKEANGEGLKITNGTQLTTGSEGSIDVHSLSVGTSSIYTTNGTSDRIGSGSVESGGVINVGDNAVVNLGKGAEDLLSIKSGGTLNNDGTLNVTNGADVVVEKGGTVSNAGGQINVAEGSKVQNEAEIRGGDISLAEGSSFVTTGTVQVDKIIGSEASLTVSGADASVEIDEKAPESWINNSRISVEDGAKLYEEKLGTLGADNTYVLKSETALPTIFTVREGTEDVPKLREEDLHKPFSQLVLRGGEFTGQSNVVIDKGGYLDVDRLTLPGDKHSVISLNDGGALRTSMDQIFHPLSQIQASAVKDTVRSGVDFNGGYLIFDDDQYTVQQVASAVSVLQDAGSQSSVAFIGNSHPITELRVSDAREFIPGNEIILSEATLVNDQPEEEKYKEDGRGKVTIGNRTPVGEHNYEISAPITVKNIGGKLDLGYKEVHLIEVIDGRKFGLLGAITGRDAPIETGTTDISQRLFVDCGIGGTVRVKDGEFRLGVGFDVGQEDQTSKGWIGYGEIFDKGAWTIRGGDYLVKNIQNLGIVQVENGAILRTESYSDNPNEILNETAGEGFGIRNDGSFFYEGGEHEFNVYGTFVNRGLTNFGNAETLKIGGRLEDYSLIDFAGTDRALKNLEVLKDGSAVAYNRHFGEGLSLHEGSIYEVSLTPAEDSEAKAQWKHVNLDGTLKVNAGSTFNLRESGSFHGTGLIANQGTVDLTSADKASAGAVQNRAGANLHFVDLSLNRRSTEVDSLNAGQMEGRSLSLEAGHKFRQEGSGSMSVSELKMEEETVLENLGGVQIKAAPEGFSPSHEMKGQFINRGKALLAETKLMNIGAGPVSDQKVEAKFHTTNGAQTTFADVSVKTGSELKNEGQENGKNLVVEKQAAYLITSRGESVWEDVRLEGNATVSGGKLQVTTGFLRVEDGATLVNDGGTIHAHLIDESHVAGSIINKGEARFNQLTLSEGSESHNYGYQVGKLLLVRSNSTGHNTYEASNSQWEKVELNEALTNRGSFVITHQLDAKADITNHETGVLDTSGTQGFSTAHNLINYGDAKHQDVTLGDLSETQSLGASQATDQTNSSAAQEGTELANPLGKTPGVDSDSDPSHESSAEGDKPQDENLSEKEPTGEPSKNEIASVVRTARMENHGRESGRNLTITGSSSYLNTAKTQWQNLTIRDNGTYESTAGEVKLQNFNLEKGQALVRGGSLETAVNASFKGGTLEIGGASQYAKAMLLTTPTDLVNSQINIHPYGDVGFGANAIALADEKGAIAASTGKARLSMTAPLTFGAKGGMQVGAVPTKESVNGLYFGKDSALVMNFAELGPNGALLTSEPGKEIVVEPGAELYVNLSGVKKGNYYISRGFNTAANEASDGTWTGGWDKEYLIAIPKESVARWKLFLHHDPEDVWLEAKLAEIPDVEAIEVATELLDTEGEKDYGPGGKFVIDVLNNEERPVKENAQIYNSFVNLAFAGGQLSTAYSSLNNAAQVLEGRTSMIAENFNRNGYVANKHRNGDLWFETIGKHEKVSRYETRKMSGVGYTSNYYGFIGGIDHLFPDQNLLTGVAISYQKGNAKSRGLITHTKNQFETFGAELYGYWSPGPFLNIAGDVGYYRNNADVTQHLGGAGGFHKATADTSTNMITAAVRAESTIKTRLLNIIPHAGVRYILTNTDRYYSKLDGQKAFKNDPHTTSTVQFPIGVGFRSDLITKGGWKVRPQLNTSVVLQAGHKKQKILFSTADDAISSRIYGQFTGAYAFLASLGLQAEKNNATFGLRYSVSAGQGGRIDQAVKLEAIWRF